MGTILDAWRLRGEGDCGHFKYRQGVENPGPYFLPSRFLRVMKFFDLDFGVLDCKIKIIVYSMFPEFYFFEAWEHAGQQLGIFLTRATSCQGARGSGGLKDLRLEQPLVERTWVWVYLEARISILWQVWISKIFKEDSSYEHLLKASQYFYVYSDGTLYFV